MCPATIEDIRERDALDARIEAQGNEIAGELNSTVLGIAMYLNHGMPGYTNIVPDLTPTRRIEANNLSRQIAVLFKLHIQRLISQRGVSGGAVLCGTDYPTRWGAFGSLKVRLMVLSH